MTDGSDEDRRDGGPGIREAVWTWRRAVGLTYRTATDRLESLPASLRVVAWLSGGWVLNEALLLAESGLAVVGTELRSLLGTLPPFRSVETLSIVFTLWIVVGNQMLLMRNLIRMEGKIDDMDAKQTRSDGGVERRAGGETGQDEVTTTGGWKLSGALIGATIGWSFGPGGVLSGTMIGAILGDELEKWCFG